MVLQSAVDTGQVDENQDVMLAQGVDSAEARMHEECRRIDTPAWHDDFAPGGRCVSFQRDRLDSTFMRPYIVAHEDRLSTSVCDDG